ncbi:MAG TPA: glycine cleavage system aminomethyltransferase GcvT [Candidatus Izemoplasmatales bacterium]|nr:glycine cleavage system aminomethyltransferase GcvT [Candidatus Izemoplasmatales bacterium]
MENLKTTPLHDEHIKLDAKMVDFAGFHMPISYQSIKEEHEAVRTQVGMFDVSHMGEIMIQGNEAESFVEYLFTNKVHTLSDGQINYGMMLYENATVVDDLLVYKMNENQFFLVVNASNIKKDYDHILKLSRQYDVDVENQSDFYAEIAVQGPNAEASILNILGINLGELKFFNFSKYAFNTNQVLISRTGYTGEDGFEIYGKPSDVLTIWQKLIEGGVIPCGLGSRDTLRFEANLPLYGHEISENITPIEAGLKYFVKIDSDIDFHGKKHLQTKPVTRRVVGLELEKKAIPREGYKVFKNNDEIGYITTGYLSITTRKPIALAMINRPYTKRATKVEVQIRNKMIPGIIRNKKFLKDNK